MDASRFGPWLGAELSQRGMSQAELARRIEASNGTVSSWVNSTRRPTPASCRKIAGVLRVPMDVALAMAGHRPLGPESWPVDMLEVAEMMMGLPERERMEVVAFVRWRAERQEARHG